MQEIRCKCNKLLCTREGTKTTIHNQSVQNMDAHLTKIDNDRTLIKIKCPKCGEINEIIA